MNKAYMGEDGKAQSTNKAYVGINNIARKIVKGYVGVNGVARYCFPKSIPIPYLDGTSTYQGLNIKVYAPFVNLQLDDVELSIDDNYVEFDEIGAYSYYAGTCTITMSLKSPYTHWADGTTADKTVTWTIKTAVTAPPTPKNSIYYNSHNRVNNVMWDDLEWVIVPHGYMCDEITATPWVNAGTYQFKVILGRNYRGEYDVLFTNGVTEVTINGKINKVTAYIYTYNDSSVWVEVGHAPWRIFSYKITNKLYGSQAEYWQEQATVVSETTDRIRVTSQVANSDGGYDVYAEGVDNELHHGNGSVGVTLSENSNHSSAYKKVPSTTLWS